MTDEANAAPSNGAASETIQPVAQTTTSAPAPATQVESKPAPSSREALERAFASVTPDAKPPTADRGDGRNDRGQFAPKEGAATDAKPADPAKPPAEAAKPTDPLKPAQPEAKPTDLKPVGNAPAGFTKAAQEAWAQTPEAVRGEVERRMTELTQGIEGYRQTVEPVRKFFDMAKQHGTTLDAALTNYTQMEDLLHRDFVGGVRQLCQNLGVHPAQLVQALTGQQVNGQMAQPSMETQQLRQTNTALEQKIAALEQKLGGFETNFNTWQTNDQITRFASDPAHKYFNELRQSMGEMLATGYAKDMQDAYDKCLRLSPEVFAKAEAEKQAALQPKTLTPDPAQTQAKALLSPTGSPPVGSNPSSRKPAGSAREALQNAFAHHGL